MRPDADRLPAAKQPGPNERGNRRSQADSIEAEEYNSDHEQEAHRVLHDRDRRQLRKVVCRAVGRRKIERGIEEDKSHHAVGKPGGSQLELAVGRPPDGDARERHSYYDTQDDCPGLCRGGHFPNTLVIVPPDIVRKLAIQTVENAQLQESREPQRNSNLEERPYDFRPDVPLLQQPTGHSQRVCGEVSASQGPYEIDQA